MLPNYRIIQHDEFFIIEKRSFFFGWQRLTGYYLYNTFELADAAVQKIINPNPVKIVKEYF